MAKKAAADSSNKSQAIRDYLKANPGATAKTIVPALAEKGIEITAQYAAMIKSNMKKKKPGKKKRGNAAAKPAAAKPAAAPKPAAAKATSSTGLSADDVVAAKSFADQVGSVEQALKALETLQKLQ